MMKEFNICIGASTRKLLTYLLLFTVAAILIFCNEGENKSMNTNKIETKAIEFDSVKATNLGADIYGMKKYVFAFLKRGPNREKDPARAAALQKAHLENINRMAEEGKLVLAGPFLDDSEIRGIYIFNVESNEEAEALTNSDPAIKAGNLVMELKPWYGSAALIEINGLHKAISKENP